MSFTITRLSDGEELTVSSATYLHPPFGVFGGSFDTDFYSGKNSESRLISRSASEKGFTLTFTSKDQTGTDQRNILSFFQRGDRFSLTESSLEVDNFEFSFISGSTDGYDTELTCQALWGWQPTFTTSILAEERVAADGSSTAVEQTFSNTFGKEASIQLSIIAEENLTWDSSKGGQLIVQNASDNYLLRVIFTFGKLSETTGDPVNSKAQSVIIDTDREIVNGTAIISAVTWLPGTIADGNDVTVKVPSINYPFIESGKTWTLKVEAVAIDAF